MAAAFHLGRLAPDDLQALQARGIGLPHEAAAADDGAARVALAGFDPAEIDEIVRREIGVER
jgi:hypothetical protein